MRILLILPLLVLIYSCKSKATSHKPETGSAIHPADTIIVDTNTYTWDDNYAALKQQRQQKQYRVEDLPLCDDSKGKFLDDAKLNKYG